MSPVSFVEEVKVGKPADEQDADGWNGVEIHEDPGADDSVDPCYGQQEAKRGDGRDGKKSHVFSVCMCRSGPAVICRCSALERKSHYPEQFV